jgi:hypothetical protein
MKPMVAVPAEPEAAAEAVVVAVAAEAEFASLTIRNAS